MHHFPIISTLKRCLIVLLICPIFGACFMTPKAFVKKTKDKSYDAIIVPGIPFDGDSWGLIMKWRVHWAVHLYHEGIAKNIIFSGSSVYSPYVESKIMSLYAQQLGVPKQNIFTEEKAEHSSENLYYAYKLAQQQSFQRLALATDPFQDIFLQSFKKKMCLEHIESLPVVFKTLHKLDLYTPLIDPSSARVNNFKSIIERQSYALRLKGTKGHFIQYQAGESPAELRASLKNTSLPNQQKPTGPTLFNAIKPIAPKRP